MRKVDSQPAKDPAVPDFGQLGDGDGFRTLAGMDCMKIRVGGNALALDLVSGGTLPMRDREPVIPAPDAEFTLFPAPVVP